MSKMTPNWSQRGSQNGAKIGKNKVLEAPCFKDGSQVASRAPPGSILKRFWDHFGTIFVNFLTYVWWFLHALCSSMLQTNTFKIARNHQKNAAESFQETASLFVQACIEKFTSARQRAFRSLLVQVETGQMSAAETGRMSAVETRQMSSGCKSRHLSCLNTQCWCLRSFNCGNITMLKSQKGGLALNRRKWREMVIQAPPFSTYVLRWFV